VHQHGIGCVSESGDFATLFFLVRQHWGGFRYRHFAAKFKACDFFLWGYLKSQVFKAPAPRTVQELKHRIQQEVKRIHVEMLQRVMGDVCKRPTECLERNGGHLKDVILGKEDFCFQCVKLLNVLN
jgi:hypothetical protein